MSRRHGALVSMLATLLGTGLAGPIALAQDRATEALPSFPNLSVLPAETAAHRALDQSPQIQIAKANLAMGDAQRRKLQSGLHEWQVSVTQDQRTDPMGEKFSEQEYGLSRALRWPHKYQLDQQLGEVTTEVAEYAFEDAWHEAGRALLASWFDCLRAQGESRVLAEQVQVLEQQLDAVRRRVNAGDAAAIEQAQAEAELERVRVQLGQAQQAARSAVFTLQQQFPDITPPDGTVTLDTPVELTGSDPLWLAQVTNANHEIKLADAQATLATLQARRAGQERLADPTVGLHYSDNIGGDRKTVGMSVTLPIGGTARRSDYTLARATASSAEQSARATRLSVEADARRDLLNARASFQQWRQLQQVNDQSRRNAEVMQRGYTLGEFSYTDLQTARRQALEAASAAQMAQLNALEAQARLRVDAHLLWTPDEDETTH